MNWLATECVETSANIVDLISKVIGLHLSSSSFVVWCAHNRRHTRTPSPRCYTYIWGNHIDTPFVLHPAVWHRAVVTIIVPEGKSPFKGSKRGPFFSKKGPQFSKKEPTSDTNFWKFMNCIGYGEARCIMSSMLPKINEFRK